MWFRIDDQRKIEEKLDKMADVHVCKCGHSAKHHYTGYFGDPIEDQGSVIVNASDKHCLHWDCGKMELCKCKSFQREMVSLCYFPKEKIEKHS